MPDLGRPAGQRPGGAQDGAPGGGGVAPAPALRLALATSAELPGLDPDSTSLLPAFAAQGIDARPCVWSDPDVDWAAFDAVVVRSTWDYFDHADAFRAWIDRVEQSARLVLNPPDVLRWNAHKGYLRDLGERGVPVVDTVWLAPGERHVATEDAVVKPAVSGGSEGLFRVRAGEEVVAAEELMVQPLLRSIADEGELSLLFADRVLSHAVRKVPAAGDIRSQPEFGSTVTRVDPDEDARTTAQRVLDAVDGALPYARVDLVRAADGTLRLIELEVIEPQLYLQWDPDAAARFVSAIAAAARSA